MDRVIRTYIHTYIQVMQNENKVHISELANLRYIDDHKEITTQTAEKLEISHADACE
jgi:hypothetical protein